LSTDCSVRQDRICDTSQPGGYCTQNCQGGGCPDKAACVLYGAAIPGCGFNDRSGPSGSRVARSFCTARCESDSDCRTDEDYVCADPRTFPWNATILDDDQSQKTCLVRPTDAGARPDTSDAAVCRATSPDGGPPPIEAGTAAAFDGSAGTSSDAGVDASDGG
jgi:hypothetical protein